MASTTAGAPPRIASRSFPRREAAGWRRIRRYAVPGWMIERAAERRLAGDWRGACAAAGVDVTFGLPEIARAHGRPVADALEDDLRHFAPDLLRWHLPRVGRGRTTLTPSQTIVLARPGAERDAPCLYVTTPRWTVHGPQRPALGFGRVPHDRPSLETDWRYCVFWRHVTHNWAASRHLWDARHAHELLERCGGGKDRAPFSDPDGTPRTADRLPATGPHPDDPAAHTEWVTVLHDRGETAAAFAAAGIELDTAGFELDEYFGGGLVEPLGFLTPMPLALTRLEPEIRRLRDLAGDRFWIPCTQHAAVLLEAGAGKGLRVQVVAYEPGGEPEGAALLPEACWRRLPDLDLLRDGFPAERLHPLVREALFPALTATGGPDGPEPPAPVRVRCRGEWHEVSFRDGALHMPHTAEEQRRERALQALGGAVAGCFAVRHAWRTGTGRLPKALHDQRRELLARVQHGDTPAVLRLLDAGVDPHVRDARRRTLLHKLHLLDHEPLLPRLLAAGLDIEAADEDERTPLFVAVCEDAPPDLVRALLDAGARIDAIGKIHDEDVTLHRLIEWLGRSDLEFLAEMIERDHPELLEEE